MAGFGNMPSLGGASSGSSGGAGFASYLPMLLSLMQGGGQQQPSAPPAVDNTGLLGPPVGSSQAPPIIPSRQTGGVDAALNETQQKREGQDDPNANPFVGFFDKLDNNLQSPSKQIGLGLLGQQDPRLAMAAIAMMGLLGGENDSTSNQ